MLLQKVIKFIVVGVTCSCRPSDVWVYQWRWWWWWKLPSDFFLRDWR